MKAQSKMYLAFDKCVRNASFLVVNDIWFTNSSHFSLNVILLFRICQKVFTIHITTRVVWYQSWKSPQGPCNYSSPMGICPNP